MKWSLRRTLWTVSISCLILWLMIGMAAYSAFASMEERGQLGDMFGVVNSLFSGGALIGVIVTILLQKQELEETRMELRRAAVAQENVERALARQVRVAKEAALVGALDTLIRQNGEILEKDSSDDVARRMPHYREAREKVVQYSRTLEEIVGGLMNDEQRRTRERADRSTTDC